MEQERRDERYHDGPYGFVSPSGSPDGWRQQIGADRAGHERATGLSGTLVGTLTAITPVRVGTGILEVSDQPDIPLYQPMFRVNGVPAIPGSSLKGAVRAVVEAITHSCLLQTRAPTRGLQPCSGADLCPACRMFGAQGFLGRVAFADALLTDGQKTQIVRLPQLWRPRSEVREIYSSKAGGPRGRKFYKHGYPEGGTSPTEVCPMNSAFALRMDFRDLAEDELGVLLWAVGCRLPDDSTPPIKLKLGGSKPSCCGSVAFTLQALRAGREQDRWTRAFGSREPGQADDGVDPTEYMRAAQSGGILAKEQFDELCAMLASVSRGNLRKCGYETMDERERGRRRW